MTNETCPSKEPLIMTTFNKLIINAAMSLQLAREFLHDKDYVHAEKPLSNAQANVWEAQSKLNCFSSQGMKDAVKSSQNKIDSVRFILDKKIASSSYNN